VLASGLSGSVTTLTDDQSATDASATVIHVSETPLITAGGAPVTMGGTTFSLASNGALLEDGTTTAFSSGAQVLASDIGGSVLIAPSSGEPIVEVSGKSIVTPGGAVATIHGTTVSLAPNGALVEDGTTVAITSGAQILASQLSGSILLPGPSTEPIVEVSGRPIITAGGAAATFDGTTVSLAPGGALVEDGTTVATASGAQSLASQLSGSILFPTSNAEPIVEVSGRPVITAGGAAATIDGTTVSLASDGALVEDGTTVATASGSEILASQLSGSVITPAPGSESTDVVLTAGGVHETSSIDAGSGLVVVDGVTLTPGGAAQTIDGQAVSDLGGTAVVIGTGTRAMTVPLSGLQGIASGDKTLHQTPSFTRDGAPGATTTKHHGAASTVRLSMPIAATMVLVLALLAL